MVPEVNQKKTSLAILISALFRNAENKTIKTYIQTSSGNKRPVKNLGWLLRNWKNVKRFIVMESSKPNVECFLTAELRNDVGPNRMRGGFYRTDFASREVLAHWLVRPIFLGVKILWFGKETKIAKGKLS